MINPSLTDAPLTDARLANEIAGERRDLATLLARLPDSAWDAPSLCDRWRVREVVAHMTMPLRYSPARFAAELARSGGRFNAMADRCARRDAAAPPGELLAALADNVTHPWRPPRGGYAGALTHDVIHGLDIVVPLGLGRRVPPERLLIVLQAVTAPEARRHFGTDLSGVELRATDIAWSCGSGAPMTGLAQDLALVACGRKLPHGCLAGQPAARFTATGTSLR